MLQAMFTISCHHPWWSWHVSCLKALSLRDGCRCLPCQVPRSCSPCSRWSRRLSRRCSRCSSVSSASLLLRLLLRECEWWCDLWDFSPCDLCIKVTNACLTCHEHIVTLAHLVTVVSVTGLVMSVMVSRHAALLTSSPPRPTGLHKSMRIRITSKDLGTK